MTLSLLQALRRFSQQYGKTGGWDFSHQDNQYRILQKLYAKYGLTLERTSFACPEQYNVFKADKQVGYLRLRHGEFRVDYPECCEETIYLTEPDGDGMFEHNERFRYMREALNAILNKLKNETP